MEALYLRCWGLAGSAGAGQRPNWRLSRRHRVVAGQKAGKYRFYHAADSDVHKLIEAAAYFRATGKRLLLDAAMRLADHLAMQFPVDETLDHADHPQVGIGLMRLFEITRERRYLVLADHFARYVTFARPPGLGGVVVLHAFGCDSGGKAVPLTFVPYFAWQNRWIVDMAVWLIEDHSEVVPLDLPEDETKHDTAG